MSESDVVDIGGVDGDDDDVDDDVDGGVIVAAVVVADWRSCGCCCYWIGGVNCWIVVANVF